VRYQANSKREGSTMRPRRLLAISITAAIALTALLAAAAYALPEFLPFTNNNTFTSKNDATPIILENSAGTKIECTSENDSGGLETDTLGTFHITYEKCTSVGFTCTTEGDTSGLILSEGSFHYVYDTLGPKPTGAVGEEPETLGIAILSLSKELSFSCAGGLVTNKIRGTYLCLILTPLVSSLTHLVHCLPGTAKGEARERAFWNDNGTMVAVELESDQNEGGFKESNVQMLYEITTPLDGSWMNE
jgi:hypothetical protein